MKAVIYVSLVLSIMACGDDEKPNNPTNNTSNNSTSNNSTSNNSTSNNNTSNNSTSNNSTSNNNTSNNNTSNNPTNGFVECGEITFEGECVGTNLRFCHPEQGLLVLDCADAGDSTGTCIDIPSYGSDCAVSEGDACLLDDETTLFCDSEYPRCLWDTDGYVCRDSSIPSGCFDDFEPSCGIGGSANIFTHTCFHGQPIAVDCAAIGGQCEVLFTMVKEPGGDLEPVYGCRVAAGGQCDDEFALCDTVLNCVYENEGDLFGTCQ